MQQVTCIGKFLLNCLQSLYIFIQYEEVPAHALVPLVGDPIEELQGFEIAGIGIACCLVERRKSGANAR